MKCLFTIQILVLFLFTSLTGIAQNDTTYAERLGYPKGARVAVMHVDDVGMSYDSNIGAIETMTKGVATSCSIMMPCPWVPGFFHFLKEHPKTDAGLHLTLTSEWKDYRWGPLSGKSKVPGLVDPEGAMWASVADVVKNATPHEVEAEIRAQIERAIQMGFRPTHLDSHMGTLFASQAFLERYLKIGIEFKIPVMFPGGHNTLIAHQLAGRLNMDEARMVGKMLWNAGLPVIDDLHNESYSPHLPAGVLANRESLNKHKTQFYIDAMKSLKPGITYVIMHCTKITEVFQHISDSGPIREGDFLAMLNPELKKFIEKEGIILTTMRELMERRQKVSTKY
jgi:chitin disaccharide deacetylase